MKDYKFICIGFLSVCMAEHVYAQKEIDAQVLENLRRNYVETPANCAIQNAMEHVTLKDLSTNKDNNVINSLFSVEVKNSGISDQQKSGRCWLFTGTNVLRNQAMKKFKIEKFFFSQNHLFFYDQLEKSNLFLQGIIDTKEKNIDDQMVQWLFRNPLSDGGTYTGVADLVMKYGLVPQEVMSETYISNNTGEFCSCLKRKLREYGIQLRKRAQEGASESELQKLKVDQLGTVYRLLVLAYGQPPKSFTWAPKDKDGHIKGTEKTYTPLEFYKVICDEQEDLYADYVMLMNDPSRPYNQVYEIDYDRHLYEGHNWLYVNLDIEDLKPIAIASLKDSRQMYFSCDVGKYLDSKKGLLDLNNFDYSIPLGTTFGMNKKERIQSFDSGSSHAMTLMAVDLDCNGKPVKWKVENSWGNTGLDGYLIMTDEWFNEYMFRVVVNRRYCPDKVLELLKQTPVRLPAWDPMFMEEN